MAQQGRPLALDPGSIPAIPDGLPGGSGDTGSSSHKANKKGAEDPQDSIGPLDLLVLPMQCLPVRASAHRGFRNQLHLLPALMRVESPSQGHRTLTHTSFIPAGKEHSPFSSQGSGH